MFFFTISRKRRSSHEKEKKPVNRKKIIIRIVAGILAVGGAVMTILVSCSPVPDTAFAEGVGEYSLAADSQALREDFFLQFGYKAQSLSDRSVRIPEDEYVSAQFRHVQEQMGLKSSDYAGEQAQQYILRLVGDEETSDSFGVITVYKGRVVEAYLTDFEYPASLESLAG